VIHPRKACLPFLPCLFQVGAIKAGERATDFVAVEEDPDLDRLERPRTQPSWMLSTNPSAVDTESADNVMHPLALTGCEPNVGSRRS